jgi:hypothetical protein
VLIPDFLHREQRHVAIIVGAAVSSNFDDAAAAASADHRPILWLSERNV